jgi:hypothetical protein
MSIKSLRILAIPFSFLAANLSNIDSGFNTSLSVVISTELISSIFRISL